MLIKIYVSQITEASRRPIEALLQANQRVRATIVKGGQKQTANIDLGLSCRWSKGVITFKVVKLEEDSKTELEREVFNSNSNYHSL